MRSDRFDLVCETQAGLGLSSQLGAGVGAALGSRIPGQDGAQHSRAVSAFPPEVPCGETPSSSQEDVPVSQLAGFLALFFLLIFEHKELQFHP